jgi:hypothetical protein
MVYYVVFKSSKDLKIRLRTVKILRSLGCEKIRRSFYAFKKDNLKSVNDVLKNNSPIFLKKARGLVKPSIKKENILELGSLNLIAYKILKKNKREKVKNFLRKTPCIRLCRGVYVFSHWQFRFDKKKMLIGAWDFLNFIKEIDETALIIPKMVIVNPLSNRIILENAKKKIENEINAIQKGFNETINFFKEPNQIFRLKIKILKKRFYRIKLVISFFEKWFKINFSKYLQKPYYLIRKTNFILENQNFIVK